MKGMAIPLIEKTFWLLGFLAYWVSRLKVSKIQKMFDPILQNFNFAFLNDIGPIFQILTNLLDRSSGFVAPKL